MSEAATNSVLSGIGVVIDNMAKADPGAGDPIADLMEQIDDAGIPCLVYNKIPPKTTRSHFNAAAFILLDWELWEKPDASDVDAGIPSGGAELERQGIEENIAFLESLRDVCFAPVFIFSHLGPDGIKSHLRDANLLGEQEERAFILVRNKADLKRPEDKSGQPLFDAITDWIAGNPSIYVLSRWKAEVSRSQNRLFWDFYEKDHTWPGVLWQTYDADHDAPDHALADVLLRNMRARMSPLSLNPKHVMPDSLPAPSRATLRAVLEASMIVPAAADRLPANQYGCGDIFRQTDAEGPLYRLNIRCDCDCAARDGKPEKVLLYLLNGRIVPEPELAKQEYFSDKTGFARPMNEAYVFPMDDGKCVAFSFADIKKRKVADLQKEGAERIGRLTAPHITDVRQRYSQWLQREGFPKIPPIAVRDPPGEA